MEVESNKYVQELLKNLTKLSEEFGPEKENIPLDLYCEIYDHFYGFISMFGNVFYFVTSDIEKKLNILRDCMKSEQKESYQTVKSMIEYESKMGFFKNKEKSYSSGTRNYIVLHRAFEFLNMFVHKLVEKMETNETATEILNECYQLTISKRHTWFIRKAVHAASYMIPKKQELISQIFGEIIKQEDSSSQLDHCLNKLTELEELGYKVIPDHLLEIA